LNLVIQQHVMLSMKTSNKIEVQVSPCFPVIYFEISHVQTLNL